MNNDTIRPDHAMLPNCCPHYTDIHSQPRAFTYTYFPILQNRLLYYRDFWIFIAMKIIRYIHSISSKDIFF